MADSSYENDVVFVPNILAITPVEGAHVVIELLLHSFNQALQQHPSLLASIVRAPTGEMISQRRLLAALQQALLRIVMRLVIILFMEARDLLPRTLLHYQQNYSLISLYENLQHPILEASSSQNAAWSRIVAVCTLLYAGSASSDLPIPTCGGSLFQPGSLTSTDEMARVLAIFTLSAEIQISDMTVLQILTALSGDVHKNPRHTPEPCPRSFLHFEIPDTEYIGLLYQSLLEIQIQTDISSQASAGPPLFSVVRHAGERKESGSFYTSAQLARTLARRTLEPLAYMTTTQGELVPRTPKEILALKICDPACGSAAFLLAALRYLTVALSAATILPSHKGQVFSDAPQVDLTAMKRDIIEHCLYGVDLSPLAVELARLSLWIEAGSRSWPLAVLARKIRVGNALIGAWSRTCQTYPLMAWMREGGDAQHDHGVHHPAKTWSGALHAYRQKLLARYRHHSMADVYTSQLPSVYEERKVLMDCWCALWFWPVDQLAAAPIPLAYGPKQIQTDQIVNRLATELRFFHWELEFADVFQRAEPGFDAILTNPPWEMIKPASREFFVAYDASYLRYGKQQALTAQQRLFQLDSTIEYEWLRQQAYSKDLSNWVKYAARPTGSSDSHAVPFRYQGVAELHTYKMFLEVAHYLLKSHGYLGMLVPASIYSDQGAVALRRLFLDQSNWILLLGFINRRHIFAIHCSFKFAAILVEKDGTTECLQLAFNQENVQVFEHCEKYVLPFLRKQVERFSPNSLTIIEIATRQDIAILEKIYAHAIMVGTQTAESWGLQYRREFDMTNDSRLFAPLPQWQACGYQMDTFGRWFDSAGKLALPLYEGRMVGAFDPSAKGWVRGKGRSAVWQAIPWFPKSIQPQFLLPWEIYQQRENTLRANKLGFMDISSATNTRSMYATFIHNLPCGNVVPTLHPADGHIVTILSLLANLNSFVYDYALRCRLVGLHLNYFVLAETPLILPDVLCQTACAQLAARLNLIMPCFAAQWLELRILYPALGLQHWRQLWAVTTHERLRLRCILDAIIADLYGLDYADLVWILRHDPTNLKGFWRVDKEKPVGIRQTSLTLLALDRLKSVGGWVAFEQEDWQFPAEIAAQLGPRFTSWQQTCTVEESWAECEAYAHQILDPRR